MCGTADGLIGVNRQFKTWLKSKGVRFTEDEVPDVGHVWQSWRQNLTTFAQRVFQPQGEIARWTSVETSRQELDLAAVERHFHELIRTRAGDLIREHALTLPKLSVQPATLQAPAWFPVPGMYGGFRYWWEGRGREGTLVTESFSRIAGGSGQRHHITAEGSTLVAEGFV